MRVTNVAQANDFLRRRPDSGKGRLPEPAELFSLAERFLAFRTHASLRPAGQGSALGSEQSTILLHGGARPPISPPMAGRSVLISAGGTPCDSAREVAEKSEIILTMVRDTPQVEEVLFGPGGVAEGLGFAEPGWIVVESHRLLAACAENTWLEFLEVQLEGKKRMTTDEFLRGNSLPADARFG